MAAGLTVKRENFDGFVKEMQSYANKHIDDAQLVKKIKPDVVAELSEIDLTSAVEVEKIGPFGIGNPAPIVQVMGVKVDEVSVIGGGGAHLSLKIGLEFTRYSSQGLLVPDFLTVRLWRQHVEQLIEHKLYTPNRDILLLDGIPRSEPQAETMQEYINPFMIIHLVCEDIDEMVRRMQKRATEQGRPDDTDELIIRKRFEVYAEQTAPVLACYNKDIIADIDALGTQAEVLLRILSKIMPAISAVKK